MLHPSQKLRVRQVYAPLAHHADQVSVAQLDAQVPPNAQHDYLRIEMAAGEQLRNRNEVGHFPIFAHPLVSHQSPPESLCQANINLYKMDLTSAINVIILLP